MSEKCIKDNRDLVVTVNQPDINEEFLDQIQETVDNSLGSLGFTRSSTSVLDDSVEFVYYQFAKAL